MSKKALIFIAMLVVAIVAMGSVSATENVTTDVAVPTDEVSVDDVVENTNIETSTSEYTQYTVTTSSDLADLSTKIGNGTYKGYQFNFEAGTYNNFTMNTGTNNKFVGNGANIISGGDNLFNVTNSSNIVITGFNMINADGKAAVYGSNVVNFTITNNVINGGKDGINIFQTYEGATISGNTISGVTRDAISLVNHKTFTEDEWDAWDSSTISGNVITGGEYGIFLGGNFKGIVSYNNITNSDVGVQIQGKKAATNGILDLDLTDNVITNVTIGLGIYSHNVDNIYLFNNVINTTDESDYAIQVNATFAKLSTGLISAYSNEINGQTNQTFADETDSGSGNWGVGGLPLNKDY